MKKKIIIWIIITLIIAAVIFVISYLFENIRNGNFLRKRFDIGENDNIEQLKRLNDEWVLPDDYSLEVMNLNGITMEWIQVKGEKPEKAILQLHGGAYIHSMDYNGQTYRRSAVKYAGISGAGVLTVDYHVAPENPYPAALDDAVSAYNWLLENGYEAGDIIIAGDSAGGGLTLATALYLRDHGMPMPAAIITMSAWTDLNYKRMKPSYVGGADASNPYISPVYGNYEGFPPMLMQAGGDEVILDDTLLVAKKAREAGVSVGQTTYDGMFHVFQMLFPELQEANAAWDEIETFINEINS